MTNYNYIIPIVIVGVFILFIIVLGIYCKSVQGKSWNGGNIISV